MADTMVPVCECVCAHMCTCETGEKLGKNKGLTLVWDRSKEAPYFLSQLAKVSYNALFTYCGMKAGKIMWKNYIIDSQDAKDVMHLPGVIQSLGRNTIWQQVCPYIGVVKKH